MILRGQLHLRWVANVEKQTPQERRERIKYLAEKMVEEFDKLPKKKEKVTNINIFYDYSTSNDRHGRVELTSLYNLAIPINPKGKNRNYEA